MLVYYNEIDPFCIGWLRELMEAGVIPDGTIDDRSIEDVKPSELAGYDQCHFFCGVGVWAYALKQAGWGDRPVWTGSCPCQPFSTAGKRAGVADERHLWPSFFHLICHVRPVSVFGEQVASNDGLAWLDTVQTDMEGEGYTFGAVDTCAAGYGAPHKRQRLYWVGKSNGAGREQGRAAVKTARHGRTVESAGGAGSVAFPSCEQEQPTTAGGLHPESGKSGILGDAEKTECEPAGNSRTGRNGFANPMPVNGFWRNAEWLPCTDGLARPVEPGSFPLAHGAAARVGRLRGYGNAIVAPQAIEFIRAFMDISQGGESCRTSERR